MIICGIHCFMHNKMSKLMSSLEVPYIKETDFSTFGKHQCLWQLPSSDFQLMDESGVFFKTQCLLIVWYSSFCSTLWIRGQNYFWRMYMNIALRRFLHNHGNIATKGSPNRVYALLLFQKTSRVLYSAKYHRQHCTLHAFQQFVYAQPRNFREDKIVVIVYVCKLAIAVDTSTVIASLYTAISFF